MWDCFWVQFCARRCLTGFWFNSGLHNTTRTNQLFQSVHLHSRCTNQEKRQASHIKTTYTSAIRQEIYTYLCHTVSSVYLVAVALSKYPKVDYSPDANLHQTTCWNRKYELPGSICIHWSQFKPLTSKSHSTVWIEFQSTRIGKKPPVDAKTWWVCYNVTH